MESESTTYGGRHGTGEGFDRMKRLERACLRAVWTLPVWSAQYGLTGVPESPTSEVSCTAAWARSLDGGRWPVE